MHEDLFYLMVNAFNFKTLLIATFVAYNVTGLDILNSAISAIDFYKNMISNKSDNPRQLWNCIIRTRHRKASLSLHVHDSNNSLNLRFFFQTLRG